MANLLRYPYDIIGKETDYLQLNILDYVNPEDNTFESGLNRRGGFYVNQSAAGAVNNFPSAFGSVRLTKSIVLPMPSNIQDGNSVGYADDSLNGFAAGVVGSIGNIFESLGNENQRATALTTAQTAINTLVDEDTRNLINKAIAAEAVNIFGTNITPQQLLTRASGQTINPNMELLFNNVTLRNFKFSFKITPRNETEANEVRKIILALKANMAPSFVSDKFLKTPNVFALSFKTGLENHKFLNRFKNCFLTDMAVNYTGENVYSTLPKGEPVSLIMDLSFKEIEPIYAENYRDSAGNLLDDIGVGY